MKEQNKFSIIRRFNSFRYAYNGLKLLFRTEHNAWLHLLAVCVVIVSGFYFHVTSLEWCLLIFSVGLVFVTEILNTSIEYLTDFISPGYHETAKKIKDLAAAAVLFASVTAFIIGLIIFLPRVF